MLTASAQVAQHQQCSKSDPTTKIAGYKVTAVLGLEGIVIVAELAPGVFMPGPYLASGEMHAVAEAA